MKKILIPTDFSPQSKHTIQYVLNLVQDTQVPCHILLLNTYVVQQTDPKQVIQVNDELKRKSKEGLDSALAEARTKIKNPSILIETASHMGSLNNVIMQVLQKEKIDLVAVCKAGGKHIEKIAATLHQMKCPLLITNAQS